LRRGIIAGTVIYEHRPTIICRLFRNFLGHVIERLAAMETVPLASFS